MIKKIAALTIIPIFMFTGCAVRLAANGEPSYEVRDFQTGMTRFDLESRIGPPKEFKSLDDNKGSVAIYEFRSGTGPSKLRAAFWLTADLLLVFLPELIGTPYEIHKGKDHILKVIYDENDKIIEITEIET